MGITVNKTFDIARTNRLLGKKKRDPFGMYPECIKDSLPIGDIVLSIKGKHYKLRVLTGIASAITERSKGRLYQVAILI